MRELGSRQLKRQLGRLCHAQHILPKQINGYGQKNQILNQESNGFGHRGESAGRRGPAVRDKWNNRDRRYKRKNRAERAKDSQLLIPKSREQECAKKPFRNSQEPAGAPNAENSVHPGNQRAIADIRNQCLRLVVKPFLISKKQEDDHHCSANEVVIKVLSEDAELHQYICDEIHLSAPLLNDKLSV